jgi:hypothetical protein
MFIQTLPFDWLQGGAAAGLEMDPVAAPVGVAPTSLSGSITHPGRHNIITTATARPLDFVADRAAVPRYPLA